MTHRLRHNYRRYGCGCYHSQSEVIERHPSGNHHGPAKLIRHWAWGEHDPNRAHPSVDRRAVRARPTDRWPGRC